MSFDAKVLEAHKKAVEALTNSYAPYSKLHVASFLVTEKGSFVGVNVENASYGATICAERSAILSAISQQGAEPQFEFMVIISDGDQVIPPCGMCLQVIKEFVGENFPIYLGTNKNLTVCKSLEDLLPHSFGSEMLPH